MKRPPMRATGLPPWDAISFAAAAQVSDRSPNPIRVPTIHRGGAESQLVARSADTDGRNLPVPRGRSSAAAIVRRLRGAG